MLVEFLDKNEIHGIRPALLEKPTQPTDVMEMAANYYEQCEKWREADNNTKVDKIRNFLSKFGDWPMLTGKDSPGGKFDWQKLMATTVRITVAYGVAPYLFDIFLEEGSVPLVRGTVGKNCRQFMFEGLKTHYFISSFLLENLTCTKRILKLSKSLKS